MENQITDSLGHIITLKYDSDTVCIDGMAHDWDNWSDMEARWEVAQFFWNNKVNKETSEDPR